MIIANIKDCDKYCALHKDFETAFKRMKALNTDSEGSFEDGNVRGGVTDKSYSMGQESHIFEAHKHYIDIHYVISGAETFGFADVKSLKVTKEYDEKDDYMLLEGQINEVYLNPGDFCITFPEDAHIPCMKCETENEKRSVLKIKL